MKLKILLQTAVVTLVVLMAGHSAMALTVLGQNPFYSTYLADEAQVKQMLESSRADVKEGLMKAGSGDLFEPLFAQLAGTEMTKVQYRKGQRFEWMFFRKKGKGRVRVDKDVVWEGNDPIDGYEFTIDSNNQRHTMTVLPVCGNLSLLGSGPIPAPPVVPAVSSGNQLQEVLEQVQVPRKRLHPLPHHRDCPSWWMPVISISLIPVIWYSPELVLNTHSTRVFLSSVWLAVCTNMAAGTVTMHLSLMSLPTIDFHGFSSVSAWVPGSAAATTISIRKTAISM